MNLRKKFGYNAIRLHFGRKHVYNSHSGTVSTVTNNKMDKNLFYRSYVQTYLQRDVRGLAKVGDEAAFLRFLKVTAARTAVNCTRSPIEIKKTASPSKETIRHFKVLENLNVEIGPSGIICLIAIPVSLI